MSGAGGPARRLFFALWPDPFLRDRLVKVTRAAVRRAGGRPQMPADLHLTLAFLGPVPADRLAGVVAVARDLPLPAVQLVLDRFGYFPGARVFWLGAATNPELAAFVSLLWRALAPLELPARPGPFTPHITLCRKVARQPELPPPPALPWLPGEFVLAASGGQQDAPAMDGTVTGGRYRILQRFPATASESRQNPPNGPDSGPAPPGEL